MRLRVAIRMLMKDMMMRMAKMTVDDCDDHENVSSVKKDGGLNPRSLNASMRIWPRKSSGT